MKVAEVLSLAFFSDEHVLHTVRQRLGCCRRWFKKSFVLGKPPLVNSVFFVKSLLGTLVLLHH